MQVRCDHLIATALRLEKEIRGKNQAYLHDGDCDGVYVYSSLIGEWSRSSTMCPIISIQPTLSDYLKCLFPIDAHHITQIMD